ncbi:MAG TPA: nucleotide exchange factor GrpE [Verrucomicrobiae bacterium]|nr:nucleotide exchange factor GrpE [Verrucomicrobiae bacterium]
MSKKDKYAKPAPPVDTDESTPATDDETTTEVQPDSISVEELEDLKTKAAKADENWDKYLRAVADLDNYRKRVAREKEELARFTSERVVSALLPALDNLERAIEAAQAHGAENSSLLEGLTQVYNQFRRTLMEFGLQEIITGAGQPFDPNLHEAVSQVDSAAHAEGHVIEQLQRGYKLADRLLRPARVVVSKGLPDPAGPDPEISE